MNKRMNRQEYIEALEFVLNRMEVIESQAPELKGYANSAFQLAFDAVCHAIDMANVCDEVGA